MKKLERKVLKADKEVKAQVGRLVDLYIDQAGRKMQKHFDQIIQESISTFSYLGKVNYVAFISSHQYEMYKRTVERILANAAMETEDHWFKKRRYIELMARAGMTYVDRKTRPPWKKTKLKISKPVSTEDRFDPRKGHFSFQFSRMAKSIFNQVEAGALKNESGPQLVQRVKKMFNRKKKHGIREANFSYFNDDNDQGIQDDNRFDLQGPVDIDFGFFTPDDIERLDQETIEANGQEFRQYRANNPFFTDELVANNTELYKIEQAFYSDAVNLVASGQTASAPYLKGVADLVWQVQRPKTCDCCDKRDGLTMTEIKNTIKDEYGDTPPSLHPNCRCELIPKMSEQDLGPDLESQGVTWDPKTGDLTVTDDVSENLRTDLSLPEFIQYLKQGGGQ